MVKDRGYLIVWGLVVAAIVGDVSLNHARVTLFLIHTVKRLTDYL